MAPYGDSRTAALADDVSDDESSIDSSFFKDLDTLKDSESGEGSLETEEYDSFSVQTPSVNGHDSDGSFSMDDSTMLDSATMDKSKAVSTVVTRSVAASSVATRSVDIDDVSVSTPSVHSVGTPSVQDNEDLDDMMDESVFGSVIDSVIHSVVGNRSNLNGKGKNSIMDEYNEQGQEVAEEQYDDFMNDFSHQSIDIMRKRSVGLAQVMSALDDDFNKEQFEDDDYEDDEFTATSVNINKFDDFNEIEQQYKRSIKTNQSASSKSNRRQRSSSRSRVVDTGKRSSESLFSAEESTIGGGDPSIAFSFDSSQPSMPQRVLTKSRFAKGGNVTKGDLDSRRDIELLLSVKKYREMLDIIYENPKVLSIQANQPTGKTFLHVIANMPVPPAENIILKVVSVDTSLVGVTDNNNNTPLHYASQHVRKGNMHTFMVFLKFHPMGASERNSDGDLPLHIVASNPMRGAEEAAHMLLETHPKAITEPNNKGKIPLHLGLSDGSKNLKLLLKLIKLHKFRKSNVDVVDNRGNSPLHCAILNGTGYEAINLFNKEIRDSNLSAYMKENERGYTPLQLALTTSQVDPLIILSLIKAAPFSAGMVSPGGDMPVAIATKANMKPEIVKLLLASDLPIELGNRNSKAGMGAIVEREHGHSWWHVAVDCQSRYVDVVTSLLSDHATFVQIVALARCLGPDKKTLTIDATSAPMEAGLRNLLRFYHRYEISMTRMPVCSNEIQSFAAKDHGEDLEKMKVTGPWLNNGFTTIDEDDRKMKADNSACEIEYVPWNKKSTEVTLRCYAFDDSFDSEKKFREKHDISSEYFEGIQKIHTVTNYVNASFTSGKLLCIAFEKSDLTLRELMDDTNARSSRNWAVKCHLILKDVAACLNHLHNESLVHGSLDATTVAQFQSKWKLMYVGQSASMGNAMGGGLRRCAPPETLSRTKPASNFQPSQTNEKKSSRKKDAKLRSFSVSRSKMSSSKSKATKKANKGLPPLPGQTKSKRKKFGVFLFGMKDIGFGGYGSKGSGQRSMSKSAGRKRSNSAGSQMSLASSVDSTFASGNDLSETDEGSLRIIAMQEDEIARLRQALEEKEHIYRRQLIEERAAFKREEVERQRELQKTKAKILSEAKDSLFRFAPEKVMASPAWDVWSFGLLMAELILGKTPLLPCFADSDDDFVEKLTSFEDMQVATILQEIRENAGELAADLVARLLHPKPQQRIESMAKVLQHKYFHEEVVEAVQISGKKKKKGKMKKTPPRSDLSETDSYVNSHSTMGNRGRLSSKSSKVGSKKSRSLSRRRRGVR